MCVFTPNTNGAFHYFWKMERILTPSVCGKKETHAVKQRLHFFFCFTEFSREACPENHALCTPQKLNDTHHLLVQLITTNHSDIYSLAFQNIL